MRFAGQRRERLGDFLQGGLDIGRGRADFAAAGVAGEGAGDRVGEVPFDPGEGGVPQPMDTDLLDGDPRQVFADALP